MYTFSSLIFFSLAALVILSFSRQGVFLSRVYLSLKGNLGVGIMFLPFVFAACGLMLSGLRWPLAHPNVFLGSLVFSFCFIVLFRSGKLGYEFWQNLAFLLSGAGAFVVMFGLLLVGLVITFNTSLEEIAALLGKIWLAFRGGAKGLRVGAGKMRPAMSSSIGDSSSRMDNSRTSKGDEKAAGTEIEIESAVSKRLPGAERVWEYPPISLLDDAVSGKADRGDIKKNAQKIEETLESFGIAARVAEVNLGPAVTQYALEIALGTKLSKITTLSNDLALALAAPTGQIRIEAPIPGRSLVGIEVPNKTPEFVSLKKILNSEEMKKSKSKLVVGLGLDVSGKPVVANIAKMPHVLIAGSTGSGKSVCINSFIDAILFRASPDEVKFILVDPKRVELTQFNGIPHLLTPVIYDPLKVISALKWTVAEMERRYKLFAEVGARNVDGYNEQSGFVALPYILIIVDELADIILLAPAEVEDIICRLAQLARATGIHLIVSTQRPSVDIITGLIKANIPCRIAFNVSSQVDSRVIIDGPGAEKLLGRGDMLFIPPDQAKPTRIQGTFVSDVESRRLVEFLKKSGVSPVYTEEVTETPASARAGFADGDGEKDELFNEAVQTISQYDRASASLLQRRLKVGYARAARILDQMERVGIVGPAEGAKAREVFAGKVQEYLAQK